MNFTLSQSHSFTVFDCTMKSSSYFFLYLSLVLLSKSIVAQSFADRPRSYFISATGNDASEGSLQHPWKTIGKINSMRFHPGDVINLHGGDTFDGTLQFLNTSGNRQSVITIQSYGDKQATIDAQDSAAIVIDSCHYISINNITVKGSGRMEGNIKDGIAVRNCSDLQVAHISTSYFQKAGLLILNSRHIEARDIYAHDNGFAGIYISGEYGDKLHCRNISLFDSHAENNPGDPTNFGNHSGNGILAGFCTNVLIDNCTANNNGWDMPRKGNGPVGIWCYEADSVVIQHCLSYQNKTSQGSDDGGGYDFDGGVTNSVIQYCLSYENQGSAFGIFQYDGATPWHNNIIRWCISENDGSVSAAHAAAYVWNSSHDSSQFSNFLFYNNTLYNDKGNAVAYASESEHSNFRFYNNIFVAKEEILRGDYRKDVFLGNDWWSLKCRFKVDSFTNFLAWAKQQNKEQANETIQGKNIKPAFENEGNSVTAKSDGLSSFTNYRLSATAQKNLAGIDIRKMTGIMDVGFDFNRRVVKKFITGACSY